MISLNEIAELAARLMKHHGLIASNPLSVESWSFKFDRALKRAGNCSYSKHCISLSEPLIDAMSMDEIKDTILHEIAHALAGPYTNHGPVWRRVALEIGCSANRTVDVETPRGKYKLECPNGHVIYRHRKTHKQISCGSCSGVFDSRYLFTWKETI